MKKRASKRRPSAPPPKEVSPPPPQVVPGMTVSDRANVIDRLLEDAHADAQVHRILAGALLVDLHALHAAHVAYQYPERDIVITGPRPVEQQAVEELIGNVTMAERAACFEALTHVAEQLNLGPDARLLIGEFQRVLTRVRGPLQRNIDDRLALASGDISLRPERTHHYPASRVWPRAFRPKNELVVAE